MTDEFRGAITSDKVETDNTNFATVKADQTCEEPLIPRENAFRQLNWQVTLEKGAVYRPQEEVGIYAQEVDCKYGVQVDGTVFGRDRVVIEHGGARHAALEGEDDDPAFVGARVSGSVISEGEVAVEAADAKHDDWTERPVVVYGDIVASHVTVDRPLVVYGNVIAENTVRADAPLVVLGDVKSRGLLEASSLLAFSVVARDDVTLGAETAVVNPVVRSLDGDVVLADEVAVLDSATLATVSDDGDLGSVAVGPWMLEEDDLWAAGDCLTSADVRDAGEGAVASRAWRTVNESESEHAYVRSLLERHVRSFRADPPDVEQFRYGGYADLGAEGTPTIEHAGEGDIVVGDQEKTVSQEEFTKIDQSTTEIDESTTEIDESTTVEDSVVNRSDIGDDEGEE
ncbi:hypothetical protein U3A55_08320 [Salarchaeum sp. III]|uniref:hypothetical protein n=1 Tax=Salarchaeum sp. III TaxID=3107927 RepID=UPI002EDAD46F